MKVPVAELKPLTGSSSRLQATEEAVKLKIFLYARLQTFQERIESSFAGRALASAAGRLKTRIRSLAYRLHDCRTGRFFLLGPTQESLRADRIKMSCLISIVAGFIIWAEITLPDFFFPGGWAILGVVLITALFVNVLLDPRCHETLWRRGVGWAARKNKRR